jgi:hypothetical protein
MAGIGLRPLPARTCWTIAPEVLDSTIRRSQTLQWDGGLLITSRVMAVSLNLICNPFSCFNPTTASLRCSCRTIPRTRSLLATSPIEL